MRLSLLFSLSLLLLSWQPARAQLAPADDFFNSGAQFYISNNVPAALERVESGLKLYPDDDKLKKLEALLKQQQQQNQQNQSQQQQKQSSQDQQKQDERKQNQSDQKKDEQQKQQDQQKSSAQKKDGEKPDKPDAEDQPVAAGQMTPEEAKHLLDAQKDSEQILQLKPKDKPEQSQRLVKDW
jgi:hypothetical protein